MHVLITGAGGFVGRHLVRELLRCQHEVIAFDVDPALAGSSPVQTCIGDIRESATIKEVVARFRPEACIHLSGIAFVPQGWVNTAEIFAINLMGTLHLLEAFYIAAPKARILVISSAEVYGRLSRNHPLREDEALAPDNPYAVSKAAADQMTLLYARQHGLHALTARPCNHIGPGQSPQFVVAALAEQILAIRAERQAPPVQAGNLDNQRDFTDVRDVVRAYRLLMERGAAGEAYNIASGRTITIRAIYDQLCDQAGVHPPLAVDPVRYRPTESRPVLDIGKIQRAVQWTPEIPLADTLRDVIQARQVT